MMRLKYVQYLLFFAIGAIGCSSNKQSPEDIPYIDVWKNYPEK